MTQTKTSQVNAENQLINCQTIMHIKIRSLDASASPKVPVCFSCKLRTVTNVARVYHQVSKSKTVQETSIKFLRQSKKATYNFIKAKLYNFINTYQYISNKPVKENNA